MDVAAALNNRGGMLSNPEEALVAYREAISLLRPLRDAPEFEVTRKAREQLALALMDSSNTLFVLGKYEEAAEAIDEAVRLLRDLRDRLEPSVTLSVSYGLEKALGICYKVFCILGRDTEAASVLDELNELISLHDGLLSNLDAAGTPEPW
jgi:tetratricopeptide (TPR) repeat protein